MYGGRLEALFYVPSGVTISATNSGGGPTSVSLTAGWYTPTSFVAHVVARLNAVRTPALWSGSLSVGADGTGLVTLNCTGTWAITFTTTEVGTVMGFVGNIASGTGARTGTQNARGLWLPKVPLTLDGDPSSAPEVTNARSTETPTGATTTFVSTKKYKHRGLVWSHVSRERVVAAAETTTYASWQSWLRDTQWRSGHAWFNAGSPFEVYWSNAGTDEAVGGITASSGAWSAAPALSKFEPELVAKPWTGVWAVRIPTIVAVGEVL